MGTGRVRSQIGDAIVGPEVRIGDDAIGLLPRVAPDALVGELLELRTPRPERCEQERDDPESPRFGSVTTVRRQARFLLVVG